MISQVRLVFRGAGKGCYSVTGGTCLQGKASVLKVGLEAKVSHVRFVFIGVGEGKAAVIRVRCVSSGVWWERQPHSSFNIFSHCSSVAGQRTLTKF